MPEPPYVLEAIFTGLILALIWLWKRWSANINTQVIALAKEMKTERTKNDDKNADQDVQIAVIQANMEHIRTTGDQTAKDVKEILRHTNGKRAAS